ncbi:MAG: hypothetical protein P1V97_38555, partial [Planctomycetota bacterium]|nr:hypothetical protein [Planctomycetota bacterium]
KFKSWAKKQLRFVTQDSKLKTAEDFERWYDRWDALDTAAPEFNFNRITLMREVILKDKNRLLRRVAMLAAVRLKAYELAEDMATLLGNRKEKATVQGCLSVLVGKKPETAEEVSAWASKNLEAKLAGQKPLRFVAAALHGDAAKTAKVIAGGKTYLEALTRFPKNEKLGDEACEILIKITGEKNLEPQDWSTWYRENKAKIGKDGKLPKAKTPAKKVPAVKKP